MRKIYFMANTPWCTQTSIKCSLFGKNPKEESHLDWGDIFNWQHSFDGHHSFYAFHCYSDSNIVWMIHTEMRGLRARSNKILSIHICTKTLKWCLITWKIVIIDNYIHDRLFALEEFHCSHALSNFKQNCRDCPFSRIWIHIQIFHMEMKPLSTSQQV